MMGFMHEHDDLEQQGIWLIDPKQLVKERIHAHPVAIGESLAALVLCYFVVFWATLPLVMRGVVS